MQDQVLGKHAEMYPAELRDKNSRKEVGLTGDKRKERQLQMLRDTLLSKQKKS